MPTSDNAAARQPPVRPLDLDAGVAGVGEPHYAIVDIGSNSVRMVVYDQLGRAPLPRYVEKSLCRLGDGLAETGAISQDGFRRTVEALRRFRAIADAMGVARIDVTGTEAIRRASNGPELALAIRDASGLAVRILQGMEEARYSALGVISGFFRPVGVVGDMGGGSLEIADALDDRVGDHWTSLPLGALPVEALLKRGVAEAKRHIDGLLQNSWHPSLSMPVLYAVGGGWRTLAKVHMAMEEVPVPVVHGYTLSAQAARDFAKHLVRLPEAKLSALAGMPDRRVRTTPAAALMLDRLLKKLKPERVVFSALGLREGWLYSQLTEAERYLDPIVEGARLIGLPLARVPQFPPALVPWTASLFPGETPAETRLRIAVCALSDIAWRDEFRAQGRRKLPSPAALPFHWTGSCRARVHRCLHPCPLCRQARCCVAFSGHRIAAPGNAPARADPRPCHPSGVSAVGQRARRAGKLAAQHRARSAAPGSQPGRPCPGQRGCGRTPQASGRGDGHTPLRPDRAGLVIEPERAAEMMLR